MNPQRRRLIQRWHKYVLKDGIDPYAPKDEVEAVEAVEVVEETQQAQAVEDIQEKVEMVDEKEFVQPVVTMTEEVVEEVVEEEVQTAESESFFSYLNKTFWWLLGYK